MSNFQLIEELSRQLEHALVQGGVPARFKGPGTQLLSRLRSPISVSVLGLPGKGKTSLIKMMLARPDLPSFADVDIVEYCFSEEPHTTFEFPDGSRKEFEYLVTDVDQALGAFRARLELPDEKLRSQTYVETALSGADSDCRALLTRAVKYSDILIWCSDSFGLREQSLWSTVPEQAKDRGFLALTMADRQLMKGSLVQRMSELNELVSEEFFGLYPIATLQAIAAQSAGDQVNSDLWKSSGGEALYDGVQHQISLGQAEDFDRVTMLLDQIAPNQVPVAQDKSPKAKYESTGRKYSPKNAPAQRGPADHPATTDDSRQSCQLLLSQLQSSADKMLTEFSSDGLSEHSHVIAKCVETIRGLSETLLQANQDDLALKELVEDAQDGEDVLLLLSLENDEDAAVDAISLLVQLKKEISEKAYA